MIRSGSPVRKIEEESTDNTKEGLDSTTSARLERIWNRAYSAKNQQDLKRLYADWANTYDADHDAIGFVGHVNTARMLSRYVGFNEVAPVLDAGAGTGAAGVELAKLGYKNLTAVDLSAEMLEQAESKQVYQNVVQADLSQPLDAFPASHFAAAVLVGVFSYGQAPAYALDEMVRVVKPGGVVVFTMRDDFYESNAMNVRSRIDRLSEINAWQLAEVSEPDLYLPKKDPDAKYRVWCFRVLPTKVGDVPDNFAEAVREAFTSSSKIKRIDHCHIWDSMASRLYNRYIECPEYYLVDCEEEILRTNADDIAGSERLLVELGCGSARKVRNILDAVLRVRPDKTVNYIPIDLSIGALVSTKAEVEEAYGPKVNVDPRQGHFNDVLDSIPKDAAKLMFFFGGSLGNIENLADTVAFLKSIRDLMTPRDRFIVGMDLHKDEKILRAAYEAGPSNRSFFLNMIRRINNDLGANFDLASFVQDSTYDQTPSYKGIEDRCVNLKLVTARTQKAFITKLDLEVTLDAGDAIQVGCSRKFREQDIGTLASLAGLKLRRQWFDNRHYYSVNELLRDDATP